MGHPDCESNKSPSKCYSCLIKSSNIYEPSQEFLLYQFKLILTMCPSPEIWKRFMGILQIMTFIYKLKNLDDDIRRLIKIEPLKKCIDFIESPDLQIIHSINFGDGAYAKSGFCNIEFRKLYKHPFFNNFLKSLDDKAKTVLMLRNGLQNYQDTALYKEFSRIIMGQKQLEILSFQELVKGDFKDNDPINYIDQIMKTDVNDHSKDLDLIDAERPEIEDLFNRVKFLSENQDGSSKKSVQQ